MKKQLCKLSITNAILWAAAILAAAILHAPWFLTIVLLPMLFCSSLAAIENLKRHS
jgi:hypothetical protein